MESPIPMPDTGIMRSTRDIHPQHYSIRIAGFSLLAEREEKYESYPFNAGGYKWRLLLYPKGNSKCFDSKGYISLYLAIQDTGSFPSQWEVYVDFKVLVFDHVHNNYLVFQDLGVKRFHELKTVLGFNKFLPLEAFNDVRNGYLDDDSCIFGAEVFVIKQCIAIKQPTVYESIYTVKDSSNGVWRGKSYTVQDPSNGFLRWNIPIWNTPISEEFTVENYKWRLRVDLEADGPENKKYLSIYLDVIDAAKLGSEERICADFQLRLLNKDANLASGERAFFSAGVELNTYSSRKVIQLEDIINYSGRYLDNNSIVVEVEIMFISLSKVVWDFYKYNTTEDLAVIKHMPEDSTEDLAVIKHMPEDSKHKPVAFASRRPFVDPRTALFTEIENIKDINQKVTDALHHLKELVQRFPRAS